MKSLSIHYKKIVFIALILLSLSPWLSPPICLLLGIIFINTFGKVFNSENWVKKILQYSIIGLGFGIDLETAVSAGSKGFLFTISTIVIVMVLGFLLAKMLKLDKNISLLIASGTAICGGSAIAATAPVIKANHQHISLALGVVFILNAIALFLFPYLGHVFHLTQNQFGYWAAIAIHDTSSVVGAASKFGDHALQIATTVKLARSLWIIPLVFLISIFTKSQGKIAIPYFILFFIIAIIAGTYLPFLESFKAPLTSISKSALKVALFLIGTGLSFEQIKTIGIKPLILGTILWGIISGISLYGVIHFIK